MTHGVALLLSNATYQRKTVPTEQPARKDLRAELIPTHQADACICSQSHAALQSSDLGSGLAKGAGGLTPVIIPARGKTHRDLVEIKRYGGQLSLENFKRYTNPSFASILEAEHSYPERKHFNTDFSFSTSSMQLWACPTL